MSDTIHFIIDDGDIETAVVQYKQFIKAVREYLAGQNPTIGDRPILPTQDPRNPRWLNLELITPNYAIKLRIRTDNVYLDGYSTENNGKIVVFEFNNREQRHLFNGSTMLPFDASYGSLENAAKKKRSDTMLGHRQLANAVNTLATATGSDQPTRKKQATALLVVIQMICEAIRLDNVFENVATNLEQGAYIDMALLDFENGWGTLSEALLRYQRDPDGNFPINPNNAMGITTAQAALAAIGMILAVTFNKPRQALMITPQGGLPGRYLVEVFWVRIDNINNKPQGSLYGTIDVTDGLGSQSIYSRDTNDTQSVMLNDRLFLTGPARAISAAGDFTITLDLYDEDTGNSAHNAVSQGQILWNAFDITNSFNKLQIVPVSGAHGDVSVSYAVMSDAAEAFVQIVLKSKNNANPREVGGSIVAETSMGESLLFSADSEKTDNSGSIDAVPLSRPVIAVPTDNILKINAYLRDPVSNTDITNDSVEFTPDIGSSAKKTTFSEFGQVEFRVTWS